MSKECKVEGCDGKHKSKGYCNTHYQRWIRYGDPHKVLTEKHGMTSTPEYVSWLHMKSRCYNKNNPDYYNYGARGIEVCPRWKKSFKFFYEDMGQRPEGCTLDRIENDGNYEPSNCKWSTYHEQAANRRSNTGDVVGICFYKGWWIAQIKVSRKTVYIERFNTKEEATAARKVAEEKYLCV